ncbi:secreted protein [Melampsora americana]|nr:secreted protein [Melampsora americana]
MFQTVLIVCLVSLTLFSFMLVETRATLSALQLSDVPHLPTQTGQKLESTAVDTPVFNDLSTEPIKENDTLPGSVEDEVEEGETEYLQRNNRHQARHGRHGCSRRSRKHRCKKHKASHKKVVTAIASAAHRTVSLAATGILRSGDATYYGTGLGACGITSTDESMIAAASMHLFDNFPGATANPNLNPICGRKVRATYKGATVIVQIVDRCVGCAIFDLDFSPAAFGQIGPMDKGRLHGMSWHFM